MLPAKYRLTKKKDFKINFEIGTSFFSRTVNLIVSQEKERIVPAIGFIVSNKVSKKAVQRNLIKRRMRAIVRSFLSSIKSDSVLVFIAKKQSLDASFDQLQKDISYLIKKSTRL